MCEHVCILHVKYTLLSVSLNKKRILTVGVMFGILASIPTELLVAHQRPPTETTQYHTHDVAVRIIPPNV